MNQLSKSKEQLLIYFKCKKQYSELPYVRGGVKGGIHIKLKLSCQAFFNLALS